MDHFRFETEHASATLSSGIMEPGDQKVFGPTAFGSPSSNRANRIYACLLIVAGFAGIGCILVGELIAGIIMTVAGLTGGFAFLYPEISARRMRRRMAKR